MASLGSIGKMLRLTLFCILLHKVASDVENEPKSVNRLLGIPTADKLSYQDKLISTFQTLFSRRSMGTDRLSDENNDINKQKMEKEHFDSMLSEVTEALDQIQEEVKKFNKDGFLELEIPEKHTRYRRDVSNETIETTTAENNVTESDVTTTEEPVTVTETVTTTETAFYEEINETNVTDIPEENGRRMIRYPASPKLMEKMLSYLEDTFIEVEMKIKPLTGIKLALSNDNHYRIGYIIATIDTLEVNLRKMRKEMNTNQSHWNDERIIEFFDKIKATSAAATTLIETLKKYLPQK